MFVKMESVQYLNFNHVMKIAIIESHPGFKIICITKEEELRSYGETWKSGFETKEDAQTWLTTNLADISRY